MSNTFSRSVWGERVREREREKCRHIGVSSHICIFMTTFFVYYIHDMFTEQVIQTELMTKVILYDFVNLVSII